MRAPLTPRPRGTIYEALPFILERVYEGGPRIVHFLKVHMPLLMENDRDALTSLLDLHEKVNDDVA